LLLFWKLLGLFIWELIPVDWTNGICWKRFGAFGRELALISKGVGWGSHLGIKGCWDRGFGLD